jgi:hypothetical protein
MWGISLKWSSSREEEVGRSSDMEARYAVLLLIQELVL